MDAGHAHHVSLETDWGGWVAQDRGEGVGRREAWERSNVVTGTAAAGGASRRNSPGGAGKPVQLSGNGESRWQMRDRRTAESL
jgi:hypothetical protein